ncbi:phosphatase PAP2 family protein [Candidatus Woesearchaeota archaeon]|nr:phosphatase PAP2 family protein [Candidatus Woesearchaeota archaeon]
MNKWLGASFWRTVGALGTLPVFFFFAVLLFLFSPGWFFLPLVLLIVFSTVVVYLVKFLFPRLRPDAKRLRPLGRCTLRNLWLYVDQGSFPSAHAARAAGLAVLLGLFSGVVGALVGAVFFLLVSWSRVRLRRHSWRDIVGGAVLGIVLGLVSWWLSPSLQWWFIPVSAVLVVE